MSPSSTKVPNGIILSNGQSPQAEEKKGSKAGMDQWQHGCGKRKSCRKYSARTTQMYLLDQRVVQVKATDTTWIED
jgi:hypothetical protein